MRTITTLLIGITFFATGSIAFAADAPAQTTGEFQFQPIVSLPVVGQNGGNGCTPTTRAPANSANNCTTLSQYLNSAFKLAIAVSVVLAVIMITIDGFKYMTSEAVGNKKDALGGIRGALFGLVLLLASYLILFIINPQILCLNVFDQNGNDSPGCAPSAATETTLPAPELLQPGNNPPIPDINIDTGTWCFKEAAESGGGKVCGASYNECNALLQSPELAPSAATGSICSTNF